MTKEEIEQLAWNAVEKKPIDIRIIDVMKLLYVQGFKACQEQSGWISVDERLPDHFKNVLAFTNNGFIRITWIDRGSMHFDVMELREEIGEHYTHWQPLPSNPSQHGNK